MERYIQQLVEDIHRATYQVRPPHELWVDSEADPQDELELEDMSHVEKYLYGEEEPISSITGIDCEALPSTEKLNQEQQALLATELEKLLDFFHFELEFPVGYPAHLRYPFIKDFWEESHVPLSFGTNHIEFCDYERDDCPFEGYCTTCDEIEAQLKYDEEHAGNSAMDSDFDIDDFLPTREDIERWAKNRKNMDTGEINSKKNDLGLPFGEDSDDEDDSDFIPIYNGFYNDDGTKIDPNSVPIPGLCIICKKYQADDWDENILCTLNRNDQRDSDDFKCGAFEKI